MAIVFNDHRVCDFTRPLTVENAFKSYFNFGQIHDMNFEKVYEQASANWIATGNPATGLTSYTVDEDDIFLNASASSGGWHKIINTTELPHSVLLKYHKSQYRQGAILGYVQSGTSYLVATNSSGYPIIAKGNSAGVFTTVLSMSKETPEEADVEIALRHIRFSDVNTDLWRTITIWMNDKMICTYIERVSDLLKAPVNFGMAVYSGDTVTYSNVQIPQLTEFAETCTLDPAENPMGGLQRAIEGRYIKLHMRQDGSGRAWRPKAVNSVRSFAAKDILSRNLPFDRRSLFNHVRQVGAYRQAEFVRPDLIKQQSHRFVELNNPFLMTEDECYAQAELSILRMESEANAQSIVTPFTPLLQVEDRITTPTGDYVVTSRDINIDRERIYQNIQAREYNEVGA